MQKSLPLQNDMPLIETYREPFEYWAESRRTTGAGPSDQRVLGSVTADIYREMWQSFTVFCVERKLPFARATVADLESFLATRASVRNIAYALPAVDGAGSSLLSPRYARRFLSLIDKIFRYQAGLDGVPPNTSAYELLQRPDFRYAESADKDPLPEYLGERDAKQLIEFVTKASRTESGAVVPWKAIRDCTAVAIMLGAGLAPGDIRCLTLGGVIVEGGREDGVPWKLSVPGNGNAPARETPISKWAGYQLAYWLKLRNKQQIQGDFVFPSTLAGRQWSHTRCYESCTAVLAGANIAESGGGLFRLRHTFALRQLAKGRSEVEVARWLGLLDVTGMSRYRRILQSEIDVV
jgi:site-specific recombinase XerD